ncbi:MAG TPA: metal ABC transporter substrate-binding protein [Arachnia sp.]|nr:metal ABC transporter substrate-binding protein [Arachnia sp.]HMT87285.1 metal ABC transporter substrate-binding protein [Arachnia sp.]
MNMRRILAALLVPTLLAATACTEQDDEPRVVAAFYALEYAAQEVVGDHFKVEALTTPGVDAHDLELSPQQIASLIDADLVVYLKGFQPAVDEAIAQSGATNVLDVSDAADLMTAEETHGHADGDEDGHDHEHGDTDPHFWLDPTRLADVGMAIAKALPGRAEQLARYQANAGEFRTLMESIDTDYRDGLAECKRQEFITSHTAFAYLADRYGLVEIGINGINPESEASPARIAEVQKLATEHGVTTIFFEVLASPAVATAIAGDLGLKTAVLDPIEGISDQSPGTDYPSIMDANLQELKTANECR